VGVRRPRGERAAVVVALLAVFVAPAIAAQAAVPPPPPLSPAGAITTPVCGDVLGDVLLVTTLASDLGLSVPSEPISLLLRPIGFSCALVPAPAVVMQCARTQPIFQDIKAVPGDLDLPAWLAEAIALSEAGAGAPPILSKPYDTALECAAVHRQHAPKPSDGRSFPSPLPSPSGTSPSGAGVGLSAAAGGPAISPPPLGSVGSPDSAGQRQPAIAPASAQVVSRSTSDTKRAIGWVLAALAVLIALVRRRIPRPIR
jgi:hypothetical protein